MPGIAFSICSFASLLRPCTPPFLYLYDPPANRPRWFRSFWCCFHADRLLIWRLPPHPKQIVTDLIALDDYWPLSRLFAAAEAAGLPVTSFPLSIYRRCNYYTMRTGARDCFGTPLEQRFTRSQIRAICTAAWLEDLRFSPRVPYWCVVGFKADN